MFSFPSQRGRMKSPIFLFLFFLFLSYSTTEQIINDHLYDNDHYLNFTQCSKVIDNLVATHLNIAQKVLLWNTKSGQSVIGIRITDNPLLREFDEPMVKITGSIHGNEAITSQTILNLAHFLLNNYTNNPTVRQLVDKTDIYLILSLNPDGLNKAIKGSCNGTTGRYNSNNYDLNGNYPDRWRNLPKAPIDPEAKKMMDWLNSKMFVLSANIRAGNLLVTYPFNGKDSLNNSATKDDLLFQELANSFISKFPNYKNDKCNLPKELQYANGYTVGANVNHDNGSLQDYIYSHTNCLELSLGVSCCNFPSDSVLKKQVSKTTMALVNFIGKAHIGMKGLVRSKAGQPLQNSIVTVKYINGTSAGKNVRTSSDGYFWRLLLPGSYKVGVYATGYHTQWKPVTIATRSYEYIYNLEKIKEEIRDKSSYSHQSIRTKVNKELAYIINCTNKFMDYKSKKESNWIEPTIMRHLDDKQLEKTLISLTSMTNCSKITRLYSVGKSVQGRQLWVVEISDKPGFHQLGKPEFKYLSTMHGNEVVGRVLLVNLIQLICFNYGKDRLITKLVDNTRIHLMPTMNPDGYAKAYINSRIEGRPNSHHVDLNRNFPDAFFPTRKEMQKETKIVIEWIHSYPFVLSANLHGGSLVANYPLDDNKERKSSYSKSPDDDIFRRLAKSYSFSHSKMYKGDACSEKFKDGITNGAAWYSVAGGMQDYNYFQSNCFELTMELGCVKYPPAKALKEIWNDNKYSLITYMSQVHKGIRGFIRDGSTSKGIGGATINVTSIRHIIKSAEGGDYWRLLAPGNYEVEVSTIGYLSQKKAVTVTNNQATFVDFDLLRKDSQLILSDKDTYTVEENVKATYSISNLTKHMQDIANRFDKNVSISRIFDLPMLEFSKPNRIEKSTILIIGSYKADEPIGSEVALRFARHLGSIMSSGDIEYLMKDIRVIILPSLYIKSSQSLVKGDCSGESYKDKANSFPYSGTIASQALSLILEKRKNIDVILTLTAGGIKLQQNKNNALLKRLSKSFMKASKLNWNEDCDYSSVTNFSEDLRQIEDGIFKDFPRLNIGISCCKYPDSKQIPLIFNEQVQSLMNVLKCMTMYISGIIQDKYEKEISNATAYIYETKYEVVGSRFLFLLDQGVYTIRIEAKGYKLKILSINLKKERVFKTITLEYSSSFRHYDTPYQIVESLPNHGNTECNNGPTACIVHIKPPINSFKVRSKIAIVGGFTTTDRYSAELLTAFLQDLFINRKNSELTKNLLSVDVSVMPLISSPYAWEANNSCQTNTFIKEEVKNRLLYFMKKDSYDLVLLVNSFGSFQHSTAKGLRSHAIEKIKSLFPDCKEKKKESQMKLFLDEISKETKTMIISAPIYCCESFNDREVVHQSSELNWKLKEVISQTSNALKLIVRNSKSTTSIKNCKIYINNEEFLSKKGMLSLFIKKGLYNIRISAEGYQETSIKIVLPLNDKELTINLIPMKNQSLLFTFLWIMNAFIVISIVIIFTLMFCFRKDTKAQQTKRKFGSFDIVPLLEEDSDDGL
ncbi:DgyrCDS8944 [Dimorphilus gyrociliatus]|uniref:DgyrCDS8944 n=1 Tax=Dimorphilus gyrociliatus TaxID=2664684 RepID=A0A7I8VVX4_9ANNE|nr:DgyrCDS8944 [Dimorphilus gyrociliatus]